MFLGAEYFELEFHPQFLSVCYNSGTHFERLFITHLLRYVSPSKSENWERYVQKTNAALGCWTQNTFWRDLRGKSSLLLACDMSILSAFSRAIQWYQVRPVILFWSKVMIQNVLLCFSNQNTSKSIFSLNSYPFVAIQVLILSGFSWRIFWYMSRPPMSKIGKDITLKLILP